MKFNKILFIVIICFSLIFVAEALAVSDNYPSKKITILVGRAPGGGSDREVRMIQPYLEKELGVPVVIENHAGADTEIASTILYRAPADGYTILSNEFENLALTTLTRTPVYEFEDFLPILVISIDPRVLIVKEDSEFNNIGDIIEKVKENPGKYAFSAGGGSQTLLLHLLKDRLNLDYAVVVYKGGSPARAAMLGGHVDGAMGESKGAYYLRDETKAAVLFSTEPNPYWPEAQPINEKLKSLGIDVEMPNLIRYSLLNVKAELKEKYPERLNILVDAILKASKNPEYLELVKKAGFEKVYIWEKAERYADTFKKEYEVYKDMSDLLK